LVKKIFIVKNATAYTWDWYCHLVVDRASLCQPNVCRPNGFQTKDVLQGRYDTHNNDNCIMTLSTKGLIQRR
jgi:hypothetical protein